MKYFLSSLAILWVVVLGLSFSIHRIYPKFDIFQFSKGLLLKKENLPLKKMFIGPPSDKFQAPLGHEGFVLTGPYQTFPAGLWQVNFEIIPDCENKTIGYLDVTKRAGTFSYGQKEILAQKSGEKQIVQITFSGTTASDYEFRLFSNGSCQFEIQKGWLERENLYWRNFFKTTLVLTVKKS